MSFCDPRTLSVDWTCRLVSGKHSAAEVMDVTLDTGVLKDSGFCLVSLTLSDIAYARGSQLSCHEAAPWRDPHCEGPMPANHHVVQSDPLIPSEAFR